MHETTTAAPERYDRSASKNLLALVEEEIMRRIGNDGHRINRELDSAVWAEQVAQMSEQGRMLWGGRLNRDGIYQPKRE